MRGWHGRPFAALEGLAIASIKGASVGSGEISIEVMGGRRFRMTHHQDCCESVEIEDIAGDVNDLVGMPILQAEEVSSEGPDTEGSATWTFYKLSTINGSVTLRWLGTSNGYYSESVSFEEWVPLE